MKRNLFLTLAGIFVMSSLLTKEAKSQGTHNSYYGTLHPSNDVELVEGSKVRIYNDKATADMSDDVLVGQGSATYYDNEIWYSVDHIERSLINPETDSLYARIPTEEGDTVENLVSPYEDFHTIKFEVPETPGTDVELDLYVKKKQPTGIRNNRINGHGDINVYPNPATTGNINVDLEDGDFLESVEFYNMAGQLCKKIEFTGGASDIYRLDIDNFASAVYLMRINTYHGSKTKKIEVLR